MAYHSTTTTTSSSSTGDKRAAYAARSTSSFEYMYHHRILLMGQVVSIFVTATGIFTQELFQNKSISIPSTQNTGHYLLLSIVFLIIPALFRRRDISSLSIPWWQYFILAIADVEANYLAVLAYQYTTISSAMLLDCFTIPVVMLLSSTFLGAQYSTSHYVGVALCLSGISCLVWSDILRSTTDTTTTTGNTVADMFNFRALIGDLLVLLGAGIYACSNVAQEYLMKQRKRTEFLGMLGSFGFIVAAAQAYFLEHTVVQTYDYDAWTVACVSGYVLSMFAIYSLTSSFLQKGDAAIFNLSLLTSDFFAVFASTFLFNQSLSTLYIVGFSFIVFGLIIYSKAAPPVSRVKETSRLLLP